MRRFLPFVACLIAACSAVSAAAPAAESPTDDAGAPDAAAVVVESTLAVGAPSFDSLPPGVDASDLPAVVDAELAAGRHAEHMRARDRRARRVAARSRVAVANAVAGR